MDAINGKNVTNTEMVWLSVILRGAKNLCYVRHIKIKSWLTIL